MRMLLIILALFLSSCSAAPAPADDQVVYDTVVEGELFMIDPMLPDTVVMVLEPPLEEFPHAVVSFRIVRTLVGELPVTLKGGPSRYEQAKDAAQTKDVLKILTADFEDPDEEVPVEWLTVAVHDTESAFGIPASEWLNISSDRYKIYLKKLPQKPGSYTFVKAVKK